jgi:hypothetical protein
MKAERIIFGIVLTAIGIMESKKDENRRKNARIKTKNKIIILIFQ